MAKLTLEDAIMMADSELEARAASARERSEGRIERARDLGRDLTEREADLMHQEKDELLTIRDALEIRSARRTEGEELAQQVRARSAEIGAEIDKLPRPETRAALGAFVAGVAAGVPTRVQVECRSITSAVAGARGGVAVEALGRPRWLWQEAGVPFQAATSLTVEGPLYGALVAQTATDEGDDKPAMGDPTLVSATLKPFAVISTVSDQVVRFGVGAQAITDRLAAESVFSVNSAIADSLETAGGTPLAFVTGATAGYMVDVGIAKIWAQTGSKPSVVLVNSANYADLAEKAATGPGDTVGAEVLRYNGIPIAVNDSVTAGVGVVVNGRGFSAHGTDVLLASLPDLGNNTVKLRAETYFALLQHDAGAVVAVDLAA